jgi:hypothetical protein
MIKAKFTNKIKEEIYERDNKSCIICGINTNLQFHHIYFWTESIYTKQRNKVNQGVTICFSDHLKAHWCKKWIWIRQKCIDYLIIN